MAAKKTQPLKKVPNIPLSDEKRDSLAEDEAKAFGSQRSFEELLREGRKRAYIRSESVRDLFGWLVKGFILLAAAILAWAVVVWAWHLLMPECRRFLAPEQVDRVQALLFSGSISALITALGRDYFRPRD